MADTGCADSPSKRESLSRKECRPDSNCLLSISEFLHVEACGSGRFLRRTSTLASVDIGRTPVPPVVLGMGLLVVVVVLGRFTEELCKGRDVHGSCSRLLPFAAGKPLLDLLEQPAVPVWILKRGKREVGTTLRVAPSDARVLGGVIHSCVS
jgi:hypothetical protein